MENGAAAVRRAWKAGDVYDAYLEILLLALPECILPAKKQLKRDGIPDDGCTP
jgi:hypothetical protein